jgi:hypothetical protein
MMKSLPIRYSDDYVVIWTIEPVEAVEDQYHLQVVSRLFEKEKWQETKKEFFMSKEQLTMVCSFFNGVQNDINK